MDECEDGGSICENARCINTPGNFVCECEIGFIPADSNRLKCVRRIGGIPGTSPTTPPTSVIRTTLSGQSDRGVWTAVQPSSETVLDLLWELLHSQRGGGREVVNPEIPTSVTHGL